MRTYDDTQILKEHNPVTEEELALLQKLAGDRKVVQYVDFANDFQAFSLNYSQKEDDKWGMGIVDALNDIVDKNGEDGWWFLGDLEEEYVFVS